MLTCAPGLCMRKHLGVNCHPSTPLEAAAGVPSRLLSNPTCWPVSMHEYRAFCYSSVAASHSAPAPGRARGKRQERITPLHTVAPFPPAAPSATALLWRGFPGLSVIPGLTWRRVPAVLLSLRRDIASHYDPLTITGTTRQTAHA